MNLFLERKEIREGILLSRRFTNKIKINAGLPEVVSEGTLSTEVTSSSTGTNMEVMVGS